MLQRIQSIWLLLAAIAAFLTLNFSFFTGNITTATQTRQFEKLTAFGHPLLLILSIALGTTCFICIFLYKNRKLQLQLCLAALAGSVLLLILFYYETQKFVEGAYAITALIALIIPVLLILAARGISKDEKLVKSLDRLR
jgi:peptidoglycan/LPS O-acetylase OafA/YrhL